MMIRNAALAAMVLLAACTVPESPSVPVATSVLGADVLFPGNPQPSPDGTRLTWDAVVDGYSAIFVGNLDGSNPIRITHGTWDSNPRWSPDGAWITYYSDVNADVWLVSSSGGEARQLTSGPADDYPAGWLPDGSAVVVFRRGAGATHTLAVPLDGSPPRRLAPVESGDQWVMISPDGTKAAYDLHSGAEGTIWVQDLAGGPARQLTTEGLENMLPSQNMWSPDSKRLAFASRRTGTWDIWTANVETGELRQITDDIRNDRSHTWSPDGEWIAFSSDRGGQDDIWIVPSTGGAARRVTNDRANEFALVWSPDGNTLFYGVGEASFGLQVVPSAGGPARELLSWPGYTTSGEQISPDGSSVLFASARSGNLDIWSVPYQGGEPTPFSASPLTDTRPRYSPDGARVLFDSDRGGSFDLWTMPAGGGEATPLTDWSSVEGFGEWSPDGSMIAFLSDHEASATSIRNVWVIAAAGGEPRQLTRLDATAADLSWSPDGQSIYYVGRKVDGTGDLFRLPITGGAPQPLGANPNIGWFGGGTLSPDGSLYAYPALERAWAFIEVLPTAGGTPRRLTMDTSMVYQSSAWWAPDGSRLIVGNQDLANVTNTILEVTWPQGVWRSITQAPRISENFRGFSPDGKEMLISSGTFTNRIMSVPVGSLLKP